MRFLSPGDDPMLVAHAAAASFAAIAGDIAPARAGP
jgi:hypothetical protein